MNADNNYDQMFSKRTQSLTITIINDCLEFLIQIKYQISESRFSDLYHLQPAVTERCAEPVL